MPLPLWSEPVLVWAPSSLAATPKTLRMPSLDVIGGLIGGAKV
ncbi:hypothetical protein ACIP10_36875 [Streptomyces galbus]